MLALLRFVSPIALVLCLATPRGTTDAAGVYSFDEAVGEGWAVSGDVTIDSTRHHGDTGASLRVGPGGKAVLTFADKAGSGAVEFWVWEDETSVANPKGGHNRGVLYGVGQGDGEPVLVTGAVYAPYLVGDQAYAVADFTPGTSELPSHKVQFLGIQRSGGWHRWTFRMDPERGVTLLHNGKDVAASHFNWNSTRLAGLNQIVIYGDRPGGKQVVWVDDVTVTPGEPMKAGPRPTPPSPPATPENDPEVPEADRVRLVDAVAGKHPRLLFVAEEIPRLKAVAAGEGKPFWDLLERYLPSCRAQAKPGFLRDATDGQRQGFWRMPTVAVHYALTTDPASFEKGMAYLKLLASLDHWETGGETDSGMSSANILTGAAILYDTLYNEMDPTFRAQFRDKLLLMARRQYHRGHLMKSGQSRHHYWQNDPQNNHRWHRDAGLVLATLAVAGECEGREQWLLQQVAKEVAFVNKWLPSDGTSHEGPGYMSFGGAYLALVDDAADRCLGTDYLQNDFWKNAPNFWLHTMAPGMKAYMPFGDTVIGGLGAIHDYNLLATGLHKQADHQAALMKARAIHEKAFMFGWLGVLWYNPIAVAGSIENVPLNSYFPDMGLVCARDGWDAGNVAMLFKCSPYGGYELNAYRKANNMSYVNVAHDDPDANGLVLYAAGALVLPPDAYSLKKNTAAHNTILVNGKPQRGSGANFTQPMKTDMSAMALVTTYKDAGDVVVTEGEASGAYEGLDRYRRAVIWVRGKYVLVLDDIRGPSGTRIAWLNQSKSLDAVDADAGVYTLAAGVEMQLVASEPMQATIVESPAAQHHKRLGFRQVRAELPGENLRVAAVYDVWKRGGVRVTLAGLEGDRATVVVFGPDFTDTWAWTAAGDNDKPASLEASGSTAVRVGIDDWAEIPYDQMGRR